MSTHPVALAIVASKFFASLQMTVFSGQERRRRWSDEDRARILTEAFSPGACVAAVARRNDISTGLIYQWHDKLRGNSEPPVFVDAILDGESGQEGRHDDGPAMVIELPGGIKVVISASAPPGLAAAALKALR
jgi:transposase